MKIEKLNLEDGRIAERRSFINDEGNEVVELFTEPKKNLNLDKRIINKRKEIVSEQIVQTIKDGEVVEEEVFSQEPPVKLEKVRHIQKEDYDQVGDYVTNERLSRAIAEAMTPLFEKLSVAKSEPKLFSNEYTPVETPSYVETTKSTRSLITEHVDEKKKNDKKTLLFFGVIAIGQVGFLLWLTFGI